MLGFWGKLRQAFGWVAEWLAGVVGGLMGRLVGSVGRLVVWFVCLLVGWWFVGLVAGWLLACWRHRTASRWQADAHI